MNKEEFDCPNCSRMVTIDELDLNETAHTLNCPSCGTPVIENYHGE